MDAALAAALGVLRADPASTVLLFDFDGTLSPIVERPEDAVPGPGIVDALASLAASYRRVGAVSGRSVAFLAEHLPAEVALSGLYGLERRVDGTTTTHPDAGRWADVVERAADAADRAAATGEPLAGMVVERKALSLTLHTRAHPELEAASVALARHVGAELGLEVRPAKRSVELHPPLAVDKGTAVLELADGARGALYAGDDVGDLAAFRALQVLARRGVRTVPVVVDGPEVPSELASLDGVHLDGQEQVLDLLLALRP
ncbi:MAG: trehalose-phosphatase [Acidimicrobiales bacterium]